ncbi:GFA family protein [Lysobacter yananisis]|uniref:GFA family protein n=1 Tax=Lysobacter yananisis TaxID=1003114 RepID=A0ABY9PBE2_9GAMM|nr:GFA family protein [Lysobacter yananisis]WMT03177.1 GFA family protein [Lysobacter yananisis]
MASYSGSCHCGAIAYEVQGELKEAYDCNCSMCSRRGGLLWFVPADAFELKTDRADVATYRFNKHAIDHHFCTQCGIAPFSEGKMPDGAPMVAINARCLQDVDLGEVKIVKIDGRSF